jgi:hypothetical protein
MRWTVQAAFAAGVGMLVAGTARAGTVDIAGPAAARPGGTVTVSVQLPTDLNNVYALQGGLSYDPAVLTPLPAQDGAAQGYYAGGLPPFPGESISADADLFRLNALVAGRLLFGYVKNPASPIASPSAAVPATALKITFNIAPDAKGTTQVAWTPYTVNGRDLPALLAGTKDGTPLDASPGVPLPVILTLQGDADGSGVVDMADVQMVLTAAAGLPAGAIPPFMENADVWPSAPDGVLTLEDANRIARFIAGLEPDSGEE